MATVATRIPFMRALLELCLLLCRPPKKPTPVSLGLFDTRRSRFRDAQKRAAERCRLRGQQVDSRNRQVHRDAHVHRASWFLPPIPTPAGRRDSPFSRAKSRWVRPGVPRVRGAKPATRAASQNGKCGHAAAESAPKSIAQYDVACFQQSQHKH